ncbi:bifunctional DNA-formamidopyrimidine glycosylase/DNA-(apurinic or apyrimidinic site) lyase [Rhodococcus antarcticus]|uniref:Formamidopyrimidine-DNA glycosylase n=1 Tax=Rhodococcus antarcticus TaxID=2987751 RepID=A0ABY6P2G3_9NOCA|nr:bifunctional DNA-formamidopyrimidine glycosylase/DNA-(apurinic or apyrimidinic site) lyase [Rhodococcus antarcticus]UZJ25699.1 bifunctional DNA-formamidopyrimidine glycosylase/DNA-(apurinic or apyrimidinic site) lyase [Rhodococcus antarcticus]
MPELPEVEVVRRGLAEHLLGRIVTSVEVRHPRAVRRHVAGADDLAAQLTGARVLTADRRGKYLWLEVEGPAQRDRTALVVHLGMSGQMLVQPAGAPDEKHLRIRVRLRPHDGEPDAPELRFVDQRTFGGWAVEPLVEVDGAWLPRPVAHIARDPLDPAFDLEAVVTALRKRRTELKRALLDQTLVSGIGNIYADEALWRAQLHGRRPTDVISRPQVRTVIGAATEVMTAALAQGGTSFDALYVNVNGASGYFDRSLDAYGQQDRACARCGAAIVREQFMNRSSFSCPHCQPPPRRRR